MPCPLTAFTMAQEYARRNVTANCIAPGFIASPMTDKLNEKQRETILSRVPAGRIGTGGDIGSAAVYLASRIPAFDDKTQAAIGVCLIQLNGVRPSDKVKDVLAGQLGDKSPTVRAAAVTVLGATSNDTGRRSS